MPGESPQLSLVLPAYNEAQRLPAYLAAVRPYLDGLGDSYEVIVLDDGSDDGLQEVLSRAADGWPQLRSLRHARNQGKGAAVRTGVLASRGQLLLVADADGATPIDQHRLLQAAIGDGADLAVGSRLVGDAAARCSRHPLRALTGRWFAALANRLFALGVRDPQCGFKMFRGAVGRPLFAALRERGYLFDVELLLRARQSGCKICEVPIRWHEVPGGHFSMLRALPAIFIGLGRLRLARRRWPRP
jgi:dolichyl-phosphate beta-glucosyltransferase